MENEIQPLDPNLPTFRIRDLTKIEQILVHTLLVCRTESSEEKLDNFEFTCDDSDQKEFCHLKIITRSDQSEGGTSARFTLESKGYHRHRLPENSPLEIFRTDTDTAILHFLRDFMVTEENEVEQDKVEQSPQKQEDMEASEKSESESQPMKRRRSALEAGRFMRTYTAEDFGDVPANSSDESTDDSDSDAEALPRPKRKSKWGPTKKARKVQRPMFTIDEEDSICFDSTLKNEDTGILDGQDGTGIDPAEPKRSETSRTPELVTRTKTDVQENSEPTGKAEQSGRASKRTSALNADYYMKSCLDLKELNSRTKDKDNKIKPTKSGSRNEPTNLSFSRAEKGRKSSGRSNLNQSKIEKRWIYFGSYDTKVQSEESVAKEFGMFVIDHTTRNPHTGCMLNQALRCTRCRNTKCPFSIKLVLPGYQSAQFEDGDLDKVRIFYSRHHVPDCPNFTFRDDGIGSMSMMESSDQTTTEIGNISAIEATQSKSKKSDFVKPTDPVVQTETETKKIKSDRGNLTENSVTESVSKDKNESRKPRKWRKLRTRNNSDRSETDHDRSISNFDCSNPTENLEVSEDTALTENLEETGDTTLTKNSAFTESMKTAQKPNGTKNSMVTEKTKRRKTEESVNSPTATQKMRNETIPFETETELEDYLLENHPALISCSPGELEVWEDLKWMKCSFEEGCPFRVRITYPQSTDSEDERFHLTFSQESHNHQVRSFSDEHSPKKTLNDLTSSTPPKLLNPNNCDTTILTENLDSAPMDHYSYALQQSVICPIPQVVLDKIDFYLNKLIEADFFVPRDFKKQICELIITKWKAGEFDNDYTEDPKMPLTMNVEEHNVDDMMIEA